MTFSFAYVPQDLRVPYYLIMSFGYAMLLSSIYGEAEVPVATTSSSSSSKAAAGAGAVPAEFEFGAFLDSMPSALQLLLQDKEKDGKRTGRSKSSKQKN